MNKNFLKTIVLSSITALVMSACGGEKAERPLPAVQYITTAEAIESKAVLEIEGMMCEHGCVASIKNKVSALAGVSAVEIDFEEDMATVSFDPAKISEKEIITEIQRMNDEQYTVTKATVEQAKQASKATSMKESKSGKNARKVIEEVAVEELQPKIVFPNIFGLFQKLF
jgi:periplasmic mercuric ion binding protein